MRKIILLLIFAVSMCVGTAYASDVGASPPTQFVTDQNYVIVPQFADVNVLMIPDVVQPVLMHNLIVQNSAISCEKVSWYAFADRHRRTYRLNEMSTMRNYSYTSHQTVRLEADIGTNYPLKFLLT